MSPSCSAPFLAAVSPFAMHWPYHGRPGSDPAAGHGALEPAIVEGALPALRGLEEIARSIAEAAETSREGERGEPARSRAAKGGAAGGGTERAVA